MKTPLIRVLLPINTEGYTVCTVSTAVSIRFIRDILVVWWTACRWRRFAARCEESPDHQSVTHAGRVWRQGDGVGRQGHAGSDGQAHRGGVVAGCCRRRRCCCSQFAAGGDQVDDSHISAYEGGGRYKEVEVVSRRRPRTKRQQHQQQQLRSAAVCWCPATPSTTAGTSHRTRTKQWCRRSTHQTHQSQ